MYDKDRVRKQIEIDEGRVEEVYLDSLGLPTFGIGHLIKTGDPEYGFPEGAKIPAERVDEVFDEDFAHHIHECELLFANFYEYHDEVQEVLINMMFNMGRTRLSKFRKFIAAIDSKDYNEAANQMVDSRWYNQVGNRSKRLEERIRGLA
tara:strand:+ start:4756 stop:5202 length:447 start_codon:yes stop_codon:yes gene_type:complete